MYTARGRPDIRSAGCGPQKVRSRLGFGRYSAYPAPMLVAEPTSHKPRSGCAAWPWFNIVRDKAGGNKQRYPEFHDPEHTHTPTPTPP